MHLLRPGMKFGIITTGVAYEVMLSEGVRRVLGSAKKDSNPSIFGGVVATGISPVVLETESKDVIKARIVEASRMLVRSGDIGVICMGGVILAGMEDWVREACVLELGIVDGGDVEVVEQLKAGVSTIDGLLRNGL
jgi:Asp/Glu/hydantoin racemase